MDVDATLDRITHSAAEAIPGIDHAGISVTTKGGRIQTLAPTDPVDCRVPARRLCPLGERQLGLALCVLR